MNIHDAAWQLGHDYPGGCVALAARMGTTGKMLANKLNPHDELHKLTLDEALRMQALSGDHRILVAMADALGYVCMPMPSAVTDDDLAHAISSACAEFGDYLRKVDTVMADGKVTPNERRGLEKELAEMIGAASHLQALLTSRARK